MKTNATAPTTVDGYIANFPRAVQPVLKRVQSTIRKAVPDAQETISYNMPTYTLGGRGVIYFAGWKEHYSLYPSNARLIAAFKKELSPYEVSGKGTIRFPLEKPVPEALIGGIARFRAREVASAAERTGSGAKTARRRQ
jgi:uncharacterized protein YdhG (YjbR/CyaY superfamily)